MRLPLRLLSASQPLLLADPPPDLTLTPAKQHFVDGVEVLCDGLLLFLEVLDPEILLVEPPAAEHQSFVPPLVRQALALRLDMHVGDRRKSVLVFDEENDFNVDEENDASVGTSDNPVGEATHDRELRSLPVSYASSNSGIRALSSRSPRTVSKSCAARRMCTTRHKCIATRAPICRQETRRPARAKATKRKRVKATKRAKATKRVR